MLLLCGCSSSYVEASDKYITPINDINYFNNLNDELKEELSKVYSDGCQNCYIDMLNETLVDLKLNDFYGNEIDFNSFNDKKVVFEIVQKSCEHCLAETRLMEDILDEESDVTFIEYFAYGTIDEIKDFYNRAGVSIPKNLIIIPENKELSNYFLGIGVEDTPTFMFYENNVLKLAVIGDTSYARYYNCYKIAYESDFSKDKLTNNEGINVLSLYRGIDDVLEDIYVNRNKLALLGDAEDLTANIIGKPVLFNTLYEKEEDALINIESYSKYINKPLVVFYIADIIDNLENNVKLINSFVEEHNKLNVLTILVDNDDLHTSQTYIDLGLKLESDVVSKTGFIPQSFVDTLINEYPSVVYIQDNIFMGGIRNIQDLDSINLGYDTFIGEQSIALIENN